MIIDHIGIVVKSLEEGILQWTEMFGYKQMTEQVINSLQHIKVVFMCKENSLQVKLIEPINEKSPIYSFAKKGGGIHHILIGFSFSGILTNLFFSLSRQNFQA